MSDNELAYLMTLKQNRLYPVKEPCKYQLPCGRCDKTNTMCSQLTEYINFPSSDCQKDAKNE